MQIIDYVNLLLIILNLQLQSQKNRLFNTYHYQI